jgi:beta-lactamase regulating signal transducer with metallopeptidase domain
MGGLPNQNNDRSSSDLRLNAVERKLTLLVSLAIGQIILLVVILSLILMNQFMPRWSTLLVFAVMAGLIAYIFRKQLPGLMGRASRFVFRQLASTQKTGSSKDAD